MEKTYFNSSVSRDDYRFIKDEAYALGITTKAMVSKIVHDFAEQKRKEAASAEERE